MRFFFRSRKFKILAAVFLLLIAVCAVLFFVGERAMPGSNVMDIVTSPVRKAVNWVANGIDGVFSAFTEYDEVAGENERLREENARLTSELSEYQKALTENEFLKEFLEIKEKNSDYIMEPATVVSRDTSDPYGTFTVNRGSLDGVSVNDPVMTSEGLIGYISETGLSYSKVCTLMSPDIRIAATDRRTGDIGVVSGTLELAADGRCRMFNLRSDAGVAAGDYVVTSGGGVFPEGLMIGKINDVHADGVTVSLYAEITPAVDIAGVQNVMVITNFTGQGAPSAEGTGK